MKKILIFGNSGSGKSSLAAELSAAHSLSHLDLDTIAWLPTVPPTRESLYVSYKKIHTFMSENSSWVIEGCYTDLLEMISFEVSEIIFLNLSVELCIGNAKSRPWESHKYSSKEAQDANLSMLIEWITQYMTRDDVFSYEAHMKFYNTFEGTKSMIRHNT